MKERIRSMVDGIFLDMKMTAANLALRDEMMANALARYEDTVARGGSEEEALEEVASSLEDVQGLLEEIKRMDEQEPRTEEEREIPDLKTGTEEDAEEKAAPQMDLSDALNKAFSALGDFSQAIVPEAKKLAREMDGATGGMLGRIGRAARKGMRDAQRAAGEALDRLKGEEGELVFDFGKKEETCASDEPEAVVDMASDEPEAVVDAAEPIILGDGEIDQDALSKAVEEAEREVEEALHRAAYAAEQNENDAADDAQ